MEGRAQHRIEPAIETRRAHGRERRVELPAEATWIARDDGLGRQATLLGQVPALGFLPDHRVALHTAERDPCIPGRSGPTTATCTRASPGAGSGRVSSRRSSRRSDPARGRRQTVRCTGMAMLYR